MLGLKEVSLLALEVEHADKAVFSNKRDGEFRADIWIDVDVALDLADIVDEHGLAGLRDLSDDASANGNAHALSFGFVADLEAHAEFAGAVVEQEDGEDFVGDDGADELGSAIQERLKVQSGVERVGDLCEVAEVCGFNSGVSGIDVRVRVGGVGRAVVAFVLRVKPRAWGRR